MNGPYTFRMNQRERLLYRARRIRYYNALFVLYWILWVGASLYFGG